MDSGWEVKLATYLDQRNICWVRPGPVFYIDEKGKRRPYFPDFYLPDFNVYLDPKNPIATKKQKNKLDIVSTIIDLVYGSPKDIINILEQWCAGQDSNPHVSS